MPPFGSRLATALNRRVLIPAVVRAARRLGMHDPAVWTYLPTDTARALADALREPGGPLIYSCLADFAELATNPDALLRSEQALLGECDLVFALPGLVERCARHCDRVVGYEPAVSTELFDPEIEPPPPPALDDLSGVVIGYVGGLQRHVDFTLLARLAHERPDWTWVFVGPVHEPVDSLLALPNVRLVGAMDHSTLPGAIATFDVGIVPYVLSAYTSSAVPTKIGEYLAMGKPVVATSIPYAVALERASDGVVTTSAPEPAPFLAALERALALTNDDDTVARCRALAATRAWSRRFEQMSAALDAGPGGGEAADDERGEPAHVAPAG